MSMQTPSLLLLLRWLATLALGGAGGAAAQAAGLPLPWLVGGLAATGLAAALDLRLFGAPPAFPPALRTVCVPVIGVLIGAALTPEVAASIPRWWPGLLFVAAFVPTSHALNYVLLRRFGGLSRATAFFAAMPGGLYESIEMGAARGADMAALTVLQFGRIALVVTVVPLVFSAIEGRPVGSAAGESVAAGEMGLRDALLLVAAGVAGWWAGHRIGLPAAQITGPLLLSGLFHGLGWTDAAPPPSLVALAQLVIGVTLGLRFVGVGRAALGRCLALAGLTVGASLALGAALALVAAATGYAPVAEMTLALAPGGVVEMGLVALSLNASPIFVTAHHVARILITVAVAAAGWERLRFR